MKFTAALHIEFICPILNNKRKQSGVLTQRGRRSEGSDRLFTKPMENY